MLVHICCSVDSHYFLSELQKAYPSEQLIGFFYNPNIHPKAEHDLRLQDVRRSCEMLGVKLIEGRYDTDEWISGVRGLEDAPEKGERCVKCFDIRLEKSAEIASEMGEARFTSTLLASPMKEQEILYAQGDIIAKAKNLDFVKINVRANGGVNKQNAIARRDNLYRQNYCGCKYALEKQREKQGRYSLEMMSDIGGRALPAGIDERMAVFAKRDALEKQGQKYILTQRKKRVYRVLTHTMSLNGVAISSYVLAHSESKRVKMELPKWVEILMDLGEDFGGSLCGDACKSSEKRRLGFGTDLGAKSGLSDLPKERANGQTKKQSKNTKIAGTTHTKTISSNISCRESTKTQASTDSTKATKAKITIGISPKDDTIFLPLKSFNALVGAKYASVGEIAYAPIEYAKELDLRYGLCGYESINPIVVVDDFLCFVKVADLASQNPAQYDKSKHSPKSRNPKNSTNQNTAQNPLSLHIESFFQDEKVFEVIEIE